MIIGVILGFGDQHAASIWRILARRHISQIFEMTLSTSSGHASMMRIERGRRMRIIAAHLGSTGRVLLDAIEMRYHIGHVAAMLSGVRLKCGPIEIDRLCDAASARQMEALREMHRNEIAQCSLSLQPARRA